ncbi:MAG: DUF262 domain-containing protein [Polyangiaceae bacterium]|nr:DUF262 domain-containing protein [Polyangiaceae bacterium]
MTTESTEEQAADAAGEGELEPEDTGDDAGPSKPWDPSQIRVNTKTFSLRQIVDEIGDGTIDLAPDFQRGYVWKELQKTRLVESILLGIPLPAFYFNASRDNSYQVIDGVQRLTTARDFAAGKFALSEHLEYLKQELEGKDFAQLDAPLKRRFQQTQLVVHVIEATSPSRLKFDIFKRINTGGSPLTSQEIRHCMGRRRSRALLERLASLPSFLQATRLTPASTKRMADRELALRFVAFRRLLAEGADGYARYAKVDTLDGFLLEANEALDDPAKTTDAQLEALAADFDRAMKSALAIFGKNAFRKWPLHAVATGPFNRPLFESWAAVLATVKEDVVAKYGAEIGREARKEMTHNRPYIDALSLGTGKVEQVRRRFDTAAKVIETAVKAAEGRANP